MKSVIPAAGLGTRFLPITKSVPKELLPILNKPTIQYVVEEALVCSTEAVLVLNGDKTAIKKHFEVAPQLIAELQEKEKADLLKLVRHAGTLPVSYAHQPQALGLGHAVLCAENAVLGLDPSPCIPTKNADLGSDPNSPADTKNFFVLLGDVIVPDQNVLPAMLKVSKAHDNASVVAVLAVPDEEVSRFGIVGGTATDNVGVLKVNKMIEKPALADAPSNLAIFGRYLLSPRIFDILAHTNTGAGDEIQLTDAMIELLEHEEIYSYEVSPQDGLDAGTVESWLSTNVAMAKREGIAI